jgi:hypothetical protein
MTSFDGTKTLHRSTGATTLPQFGRPVVRVGGRGQWIPASTDLRHGLRRPSPSTPHLEAACCDTTRSAKRPRAIRMCGCHRTPVYDPAEESL